VLKGAAIENGFAPFLAAGRDGLRTRLDGPKIVFSERKIELSPYRDHGVNQLTD
jgi:hypothetical protein